MEDRQQVINEKFDLDTRLASLKAYTESAKFRELPDMEQLLICRQVGAMEDYGCILAERIEQFLIKFLNQ